MKRWLIGAVAAVLAIGGVAFAQQKLFPLQTSVNGTEFVQNAANPTGAYFTTLQVASYVAGPASGVGGTPTIASGACGASTNGAVVAGSTNQSGSFTIGATGTTTCTVVFSATLAAAPKACLVFPANATAAATGTTVAYVSSVTTAQFVLTGSALASANYYYICV